MHTRDDRVQQLRQVSVADDSSERSQLLSDVFDHLPYGLMVMNRVGRVIYWNRALEDLAGFGRLGEEPVSCCDLLGCRSEGGALEDGCITELVIETGARSAEIEVEPPGGNGTPVWVTAAPVYEDCSRIVVQVRTSGWRQGATANPPQMSQQLKVYTLGRTRVEDRDGSLKGDWLMQRSGQLLKYLVCERRRFVPTDVIAEAIWPQARLSTAGTVRHCIHALRSHLEPRRRRNEESEYIRAYRGGYALNTDRIWVDADAFEDEVRVGLAAFGQGEIGGAKQHLERALALYQGDFLADEPYAEWALVERERLRALVEKPLRVLAELSAKKPDRAAAYLERLAELEPFDNEVQRSLIALWVRQGRKSRAVRHYQAFQLRLLKQFGEEPSFGLSDLVMPPRRGR
jgi:DNA-binding SARP family transcriptional activator